jgi:hypothetical protein
MQKVYPLFVISLPSHASNLPLLLWRATAAVYTLYEAGWCSLSHILMSSAALCRLAAEPRAIRLLRPKLTPHALLQRLRQGAVHAVIMQQRLLICLEPLAR